MRIRYQKGAQINMKASKLLISIGLGLACSSHVSAEPLNAQACVSQDFKLRDYDLEFQACAAGFSAETPVPLEAETIVRKRRDCRSRSTRGTATCTSRHLSGRPLAFCNRAVKSNRRACYYQARFLKFSGPGPEAYRRDRCAAARSGITEICFDYRERYASVTSQSESQASAAQPSAEPVVVPMSTPTPNPACTSTCVEDCVDQYYEDYDYNAEQLCYYNKCGC